MIKGFKEFLDESATARIAFYHFDTHDFVAQELLANLLNEGTKTHDLGKGRAIMYHSAHVPGGQDHVHFVVKGNKVAALNRDGSAHDRSHGLKLLNWQIDGLSQHYPDFVSPEDGLIEQLIIKPIETILVESAETRGYLANAIFEAEQVIHVRK